MFLKNTVSEHMSVPYYLLYEMYITNNNYNNFYLILYISFIHIYHTKKYLKKKK